MVSAYVNLGGLGGYLIDGIKVSDFHLILTSALMVAALALILDVLLVLGVSVSGTGRLCRCIGRRELHLPTGASRRVDAFYGR